MRKIGLTVLPWLMLATLPLQAAEGDFDDEKINADEYTKCIRLEAPFEHKRPSRGNINDYARNICKQEEKIWLHDLRSGGFFVGKIWHEFQGIDNEHEEYSQGGLTHEPYRFGVRKWKISGTALCNICYTLWD